MRRAHQTVLVLVLAAIACGFRNDPNEAPPLVLVMSPMMLTGVNCFCDAVVDTARDADDTLESCGVTNCLNIDNISNLVLTDGKCNTVSGVECSDVTQKCDGTYSARVCVNDLCCCATGANGAHVTWHKGPGWHDYGEAFVADDDCEEFDVSRPTTCDQITEYLMTVGLYANCTTDIGGVEENPQVKVERGYRCKRCTGNQSPG